MSAANGGRSGRATAREPAALGRGGEAPEEERTT